MSRILLSTLSLAVLTFFPLSIQAKDEPEQEQKRQGQNRQNLSPEEWRTQQTKVIERKITDFMTDMGDTIPDDKREAVQAVITQHFIDELKLQLAMQQTRTKAKGNHPQIREAMVAMQSKREKLSKTTNTKAKAVLNDKNAFKTFKKTLVKMSPQPRGGQGGGGRGQGGGGAGRGQGGGGSGR